MIPDEKRALEYIKKSDNMADLFKCRIYNGDNYPIGDSRFEEQSEDIFIALLNSKLLSFKERYVIIRECFYFIQEVMKEIDSNNASVKMEDAISRFGRLICFTKPEELRIKIEQLMVYVVSNKVPEEIGMIIVNAYLGYEQTEDQRWMWERLIDNYPYSMFSLNGLVKINVFSSKVITYLSQLVVDQLKFSRDFAIDFWVEHIAELRGQEIKYIVKEVINKVKNHYEDKDIESKLIEKGWKKEWFNNGQE